MTTDKRQAYRKKCVAEITDSYAKDLLCRDGLISRGDVTKELIDLKREQLRIRRATLELKQALVDVS